MRILLLILWILAVTAACAGDGTRAPASSPALSSNRYESPVPSRVGIAVQNVGKEVVVVALSGAAARAGVRQGDRLRTCDGTPVANARDFEQRVLESRPGSVVDLELDREGKTQRVSLPVEEILTAVLS